MLDRRVGRARASADTRFHESDRSVGFDCRREGIDPIYIILGEISGKGA